MQSYNDFTLKKDITYSTIRQVQVITQSNLWVIQTLSTAHKANKSNKHVFAIVESNTEVQYPNKSLLTNHHDQIDTKHQLMQWSGNIFIKYNLDP